MSHGKWKNSVPQETRFMSRVKKTDSCWLWTGYKNKSGYGRFQWSGKTEMVHRIMLKLENIAVPPGMVTDHLCRTRNCVRPDHLEVVTPRENLLRGNGPCGENARKNKCLRGHEFTKENTIVRKDNGVRECRACRIARGKGQNEKRNRIRTNAVLASRDRDSLLARAEAAETELKRWCDTMRTTHPGHAKERLGAAESKIVLLEKERDRIQQMVFNSAKELRDLENLRLTQIAALQAERDHWKEVAGQVKDLEANYIKAETRLTALEGLIRRVLKWAQGSEGPMEFPQAIYRDISALTLPSSSEEAKCPATPCDLIRAVNRERDRTATILDEFLDADMARLIIDAIHGYIEAPEPAPPKASEETGERSDYDLTGYNAPPKSEAPAEKPKEGA